MMLESSATENFTQVVVYGARGFTVSILDDLMGYWGDTVELVALVDDLEYGFVHPILSRPVISGAERLQQFPDVPVLLTMGDLGVRREIAQRLALEGAVLATANCRALPSANSTALYGSGSLVVSVCRVGPGVRIGQRTQVLASLVGHDTVIGDDVTIGINAQILGHVEIGDGTHIAPFAMIGNGTRDRPLKIGAGATLGVGTCVVRDVPPGQTVVGNPAMTVPEWRRLKELIVGDLS